MAAVCRHRLTLALLISLSAHLILLVVPGWRVPTLDDLLRTDAPQRIDAHLSPVHTSGSQPSQRIVARPVPRRSPVPRAESPMPNTMPKETEPPSADSGPLPPRDISASEETEKQPDALPAVAAATGLPGPAVTPRELALPRRGSVRFAVTLGDQGFVVGQSIHRWSHDGRTYRMSNLTETTGPIALFKRVRVNWSSEGEIVQDGLQPHMFRIEKDGVAGDAANFDWSSMKLGLSGGGQREVALVAGTQDMLSMFYQFSTLFPALPSGRSEVYVTTGKKLERYAFEVLADEALTTGAGEIRTRHVQTKAGSQTIDIWLGLDLRGLPVKIRYMDGKGDSSNLIADDIEFEGMNGSFGSH